MSKKPTNKFVKHAVEILQSAIIHDADYRDSWKASIAMAFKDEWEKLPQMKTQLTSANTIHEVANGAAERFINQFTEKQNQFTKF